MQKRRQWTPATMLLLVAFFAMGDTTWAATASSQSSNYEASQLQFGSGSTLESCSAGEFCVQSSIGSLVGGSGTGGDSSADFGPITPNEPMLEVIVESGDSSFDILTTEETATKTMTVQVRNYLSDGYIMQVVGNPPTYEGHALFTPSSPTASQAGTEQFGINAVANTNPDVGEDPVQVPSDQISFGVVDEDYDNVNQFKYQTEDIVAYSLSESGRTDYTISMIINISNATPAGHYSGDFSVVVIPVF